MATTLIENGYAGGEFRQTRILGTFDNHDEAEMYLKDYVLFDGAYKQIAPCGYERLNQNGKRVSHVMVVSSIKRTRDINGRWIAG